MTLFWHELRRNRLALVIWSIAISFMLGVSVLIYPEMSSQMEDISSMFADMGSFTAAFGMDKVNFGEFKGYFAIECGNVLGLGGAVFAAIMGASAIACEEREKTADFLLTHPLSRSKVIWQKLCALMSEIAVLNIAVTLTALLASLIIGESMDTKTFVLVFFGYFLLQVEIGAVCFGISALGSRGGLGIALGLTFGLYFANIVSNLTQKAEFLKYITPFGYADGTAIVSSASLDMGYLSVGLALGASGVAAAFLIYNKKDIL